MTVLNKGFVRFLLKNLEEFPGADLVSWFLINFVEDFAIIWGDFKVVLMSPDK
jgi:hypothetical protein